ncbi:unnamed protein product [Clonostachys solani]|uniref:Uncharacterized protein n=1 Tax=Clonostachys solani TaxID=160281 RepID=A0A9N9ZBJ2_9HYPO|nr:unnamed protein product [Clonostachys solani]
MVFNFSLSGSLNLSYSNTTNGKTDQRRYGLQTQIGPNGAYRRSLYQNNDKPLQYTEEWYPSRRELQANNSQHEVVSRRIEDVTESETPDQGSEGEHETIVEEKSKHSQK